MKLSLYFKFDWNEDSGEQETNNGQIWIHTDERGQKYPGKAVAKTAQQPGTQQNLNSVPILPYIMPYMCLLLMLSPLRFLNQFLNPIGLHRIHVVKRVQETSLDPWDKARHKGTSDTKTIHINIYIYI